MAHNEGLVLLLAREQVRKGKGLKEAWECWTIRDEVRKGLRVKTRHI